MIIAFPHDTISIYLAILNLLIVIAIGSLSIILLLVHLLPVPVLAIVITIIGIIIIGTVIYHPYLLYLKMF